MNLTHLATRVGLRFEREAALFEGPPAMNQAVREWAQSAYASHILAGILPEISRAQDLTRPVREAIAEMEESLRTVEKKVAALGPDEAVKFGAPITYDKEIIQKYVGVKRWKFRSDVNFQVGVGAKIVDYSRSQWMDAEAAIAEVKEYLHGLLDRAHKTLRVLEAQNGGGKNKDTTLVELNLLKKECLKYTSKPKVYAAKAGTTIPVDLSGWKYVSSGSPVIAEVNKKVEERNKRRADRVERGQWELDHAQEAYDKLAKGESLDAAEEYRLDQDSAYWTAHRVRLALGEGKRPSQAYVQMDVPVEGKSYSTYRVMPLEEAAKYMEPLLGPDEVMKALAVQEWTEIKLVLDFKGHESRGGVWMPYQRELQIDVVDSDAKSVAAFQRGMNRIAEVARHEVQHIGQDLLRVILGLREDAGLPSKNIRAPQVPSSGGKPTNERVDHALLDVEFYTDLADAVDYFVRIIPSVPLSERRETLRYFVGLGGSPRVQHNSKTFMSWRKKSLPKWKKAVSEFIKALEERGVALGPTGGRVNPSRIADLHLAQADVDSPPPTRYRALYSTAAKRALLHAFGVRPMAFFDFYDVLRAGSLGDPAPAEGYVDLFRASSRLVFPRLTSEATRTKFTDVTTQIRPLLAHLDQGQSSHALHIRLAGLFASLVSDVAGDRGVFLSTMSAGAPGWVMFRVMSEREQKLEELRRNDPEAYDSMQRSRTLLRELDQRVEKEVASAGLTPSRKEIMGRPVTTGTDPVTGDEMVFDVDGGIHTIPEYITKRRKDLAARKALTRVFPNLDELRTLGEDEIAALTVGATEYVAMTDDKAKSHQLTRIYPVRKTIDGKPVVVAGRYKGFYLEDLVNRAGRMIEGVSYDIDPKSNLPVPMETRKEDGSVIVRTNREPYVTVNAEGRLYLRLPSGNKYTHLRTAISDLSKLIPSLRYEEGTRKSAFTFEPKDFAAVREALGGLALSTAAAKLLRDFFASLAKHELALAEDNLKYFDTDKIGGFKPDRKLYHKQKQAMAWLESRGHSGVMALDTGLGKCVTGDTLVWSSHGLIPIREMNPGVAVPDTAAPLEDWSVVVGSEHLPVASFYYGGVRPTVKVTLASGIQLEGSLVHPVAVRGVGGEEWVKLPDLRLGDAVCVDRTEQAFASVEPALPTPDETLFHRNTFLYPLPERMTPDLAKLLGYIVAEAYSVSDRRVVITQHRGINPETHHDIRDALRAVFGWDNDEKAAHRDTSISVCSLQIRQYLEGIGIGRALSAEKTVPAAIFRSTKTSVRAFLRALFDSEGSVGADGTIEISSASERLLRDVQVLLLGFGIVGRRAAKHVKGRSHTYWRMTITGEEARRYREQVGFHETRKQEALQVLDRVPNPNLDVVPFAVPLVEEVRANIAAVAAGQQKGGGIVTRWGASFFNTLQHIRMGRRNPAYTFLRKLLAVAEEVGVSASHACAELRALISRNLLYDPVVKLEFGFSEVMDISVADPRHCFVGNGVLNHNTSLAIASMQKMIRDGLLEDGQQFLYVCPPSLRGNLPKEIESFIEDPKALRDRVKIMTYGDFQKAVSADTGFATHYAAVLFDEAQALKNPTSGTAAAALQLNHPRKILLTASPMEKSPMEVFTLVAISNNLNLNTPDGRSQIRAFRARFCEDVGGKIIGIKNDPTTARDFRVWVKQNLYFADKRDVEEVALPALRPSTVAVTMSPEIETAYRDASKNISDVIQGMVAKYRDRNPDAKDPAIEAARIKLAKEFRALFNLINFPERVIPGTVNPKLAQTVSLIDERVGAGRRTLLFTDSPELAKNTAKHLSERFPVHLHAECLASTIRVWQSGEVVQTYVPKAYTEGDRVWAKGEWKGYVLDRIVSPKPDFLTCTLTSTYAEGQNMQSFDTVIHLDRDAWNNETMKQRTARAWRNGQTHSVDEYVLDAVYAEPTSTADTTVDQIAGYLQGLESELFDRVIIESQSEALGKEWFGMKHLHSSFTELNRRVLELAMSPYATRLGAMGVQGSGAKA